MRKVIATAALVALGLAACGSSSGSKGATGNQPTSAFNGSSTSTNGGSGDDFSSLLSKYNSATFKVTYANGSDTFTLVQKPPASAYTSGSSSFYRTADGKTVSCDGTGSSATCTEVPGVGDLTQGLTSLFGGLGAALLRAGKGGGIPGLADITTSTSRTIAGRDATCVKFDSSTLGALAAAVTGSAEICLDKDTGVFLEMKTTDDKGKVDDIVATDFSTSVSDRDLTPPVTPSTIPGLTTTTS